MKSVRALLVGGLLAATMWIAKPADAQIVAIPHQLDPVLKVIGPTVSPACGELGSAYVLAPAIYSSLVGQPLPAQLLTLLGPVVVVCGSLPPLDPGQKLKCAPDTYAQRLLNQAAAAAGQSVPASLPAVVAPIGATVFAIEDNVPASIKQKVVVAPLVATALECDVITAVPPVEVTPSPTDAGDGMSGASTALSGSDDSSFAFGNADYNPMDPLGVGSVADELGSITAPGTRSPHLIAAGTGFAYPVVFALPLLILVIGGFLGRSLTQPITSQRD